MFGEYDRIMAESGSVLQHSTRTDVIDESPVVPQVTLVCGYDVYRALRNRYGTWGIVVVIMQITYMDA